MKLPIQMQVEHLSAIITAMLMQSGEDSFTLSNDEFDNLDLSSFGLSCEGELTTDGENFTAITVTIVQAEK